MYRQTDFHEVSQLTVGCDSFEAPYRVVSLADDMQSACFGLAGYPR